MPQPVIVAAARSPIARAGRGALRAMRPDDLAATVVRAVLDKVPQLPLGEVADLLVGCGLPGGEQGYNLARIVAVLLGYDELPGMTLTRYCASSMQTTAIAANAIRAGEGEAFLSVGVEMISRYVAGNSDSWPDTRNPRFTAAAARSARRAEGGAGPWVDPRESGELPDVYLAMGQTAENVADRYGVSRSEQDEFGVRSQNRAEQAIRDGFWQREIAPIPLPDGGVLRDDESPRCGATLAAAAALAPAFRPGGTVTAANCCPLNDGAAALVVMSEDRARELGITPLARVVATGLSALSPEIMGLGPVGASRQALARAGMSMDDVDLVEINEAFAAQVLPCARELGIDLDRLNVNGGAIAIGHPFGMTGARLTGTLINSLQYHDKQVGLQTLCAAGGMGMAMILERMS